MAIITVTILSTVIINYPFSKFSSSQTEIAPLNNNLFPFLRSQKFSSTDINLFIFGIRNIIFVPVWFYLNDVSREFMHVVHSSFLFMMNKVFHGTHTTFCVFQVDIRLQPFAVKSRFNTDMHQLSEFPVLPRIY